MSSRRRASRIGFRVTGRWLRRDGALPIEIAEISARGLFVNERADTPLVDMKLGELQQLEVDLPTATVRLLVVPRHVTRSEWSAGLGVEIFAASTLDRNLWLACFQSAPTAPRRALVRAPRAAIV